MIDTSDKPLCAEHGVFDIDSPCECITGPYVCEVSARCSADAAYLGEAKARKDRGWAAARASRVEPIASKWATDCRWQVTVHQPQRSEVRR